MPSATATNEVVVIGAGVAGLTAAAYLARKGFQVKVLEANPRIGGCCGTTSVNGYTFTDGAQYLVYPKILDLVFSQLGFNRSEFLPLRHVATPQTTRLPYGMAVTIGDGFSVAVDGGELDIARAQEEMKGMVKKWEPVSKILESEDILLKPFSAWRLLSKAWSQLPKLGRSLKGEFEALFSDPYFRSAIAAHVVYAGAPLRQLPSLTIVALVSALRDGMALPVGGMGRIPEALAGALRAHGAEILLQARVNNICVQNGHVTGVQTEEHGFIACEQIISTANAMTTYSSLLDAGAQRGRMMKKVQRTRLSQRAFSIQLGVREKLPVQSHLNYFVPMFEDLHRYFAPVSDSDGWGYFSIPTVAAPELAPAGGSVVEYFPVIRQDDPIDEWNDQRVSELGSASIRWLQSQFDMTTEAERIRGPREFQYQLNLYNGAVYGVSAAEGVTGLFPHESSISGLYLAGQTTYPGLGVPTAALSGIHAANLVLKNGNSRT